MTNMELFRLFLVMLLVLLTSCFNERHEKKMADMQRFLRYVSANQYDSTVVVMDSSVIHSKNNLESHIVTLNSLRLVLGKYSVSQPEFWYYEKDTTNAFFRVDWYNVPLIDTSAEKRKFILQFGFDPTGHIDPDKIMLINIHRIYEQKDSYQIPSNGK